MRLPVAVEPVKEMERTSGCDQRLAGGVAEALHHVEDARRDAGLEGQLTQAVGGEGRQLGHLHHRGVAEGQAGRGLPGGGHEGHVPRGDQRADAHRLPQGVVQVAGVGIVGFAVHVLDQLGEVVEVVRGAGDQHALGLVGDLAAVGGFQVGDLGHVGGDQVAQLAHQAGALLDRGGGPARKGGLGGGHRGVDFSRAAAGHLGDHLAGGRVDGLEGLAAVDLLAVDDVLDHAVLAFLTRWRTRSGHRRLC
jgi:hypothetical protein